MPATRSGTPSRGGSTVGWKPLRAVGLATMLGLGGAVLVQAAPADPASASGSASGSGSATIPSWTWRDLNGTTHSLSGSATVLFFGSTTCPCADRYNRRVADLADRFAPHGFRFFQVFSGEQGGRTGVEAYCRKRKIGLPVVHDAMGDMARRLNVEVTPTVVVLGPAGEVVYRGRVDDNPDPQAVVRRDLADALQALATGAPVARRATLTVGCVVGSGASGPARGAAPAPRLESGLGNAGMAITSRSAAARRWFNQGLNHWFGFNFPEAESSFRQVARLDPQCAMAHWGITLSMGMTYNFDFDPARLPEAARHAATAVKLARKTTPKERALIRALAIRHRAGTDMLKQRLPYKQAMARVHAAYPQDVNIAVLYAASAMDLRPWQLWSADGKPAPGTPEILRVLEAALQREPNHIGGNHYYIHATEASPHPEKALSAAGRLAAQAPRAGHLVHMPSHTYFRVGDYRASAASNVVAADLDRRYFVQKGKPTPYGLYYTHNLDFIVASRMFEGRRQDAVAASRRYSQESAQWTPEMVAFACGSSSGIMAVYARFGMWDEILAAAPPDAESAIVNLWWRYARGMARLGKDDAESAERELTIVAGLLPEAIGEVPPIPVPGMADGIKGAMRVAHGHLTGKLAEARGQIAAAEKAYREAIREEDALPYFEPPAWRHPVRESLGALLIRDGRAAQAEGVFRRELKLHPRSGRALFGLAESLKAQGKAEEPAVRAKFRAAWKTADVPLSLADL